MMKPSAIINRNLHILVILNKFFLTKSSMLHDLKSRFAIFCMIFKLWYVYDFLYFLYFLLKIQDMHFNKYYINNMESHTNYYLTPSRCYSVLKTSQCLKKDHEMQTM